MEWGMALGNGFLLHADRRPEFFVNHVELVFVAEQSPDNGDILDTNVNWYGAECTADTQNESEQPKTVQGERLDHAKNVHVDVNSAYKGTEEVHDGWAGYWTESSEYNVGSGQRHGDPGVAGNG